MDKLRKHLELLYGSEVELSAFMSGIELGSIGVKGSDGKIKVLGNARDYVVGEKDFQTLHDNRSCAKPFPVTCMEGAEESIEGDAGFDGDLILHGKLKISFSFTSKNSCIFKFPEVVGREIHARAIYSRIVAGSKFIQHIVKNELQRVNEGQSFFEKRKSLYIAVKIVECNNKQEEHHNFKEAKLEATIGKTGLGSNITIDVTTARNLKSDFIVRANFSVCTVWLKMDPTIQLTDFEKEMCADVAPKIRDELIPLPAGCARVMIQQSSGSTIRPTTTIEEDDRSFAAMFGIEAAPAEDFKNVTYEIYSPEQIAFLRDEAMEQIKREEELQYKPSEETKPVEQKEEERPMKMTRILT